MSLFNGRKRSGRIGLVIDLGSGSAMVALVASRAGETEPDVLWSKREIVPLKNIDNLHESSKSVVTALVNVLLDFETSGRQALEAYAPGAKVQSIQCSVAAPWSYTVSKEVVYKNDDSFEVTEELLETLIETAEKQAAETLKEQEVVNKLGLSITVRTTLHTLLNGYRVENPYGKQAKVLSLIHASVVVHSYLLDALEEVTEKMFGNVPVTVYSYALIYNCVARELFSADYNLALVDVTYEATEFTIVREGVLRYVTHTPFGLYSLARELAAITGDPIHETIMHLESSKFDKYIELQTKKRQVEIEKLCNAYIARLTELFKETGDDLAAPRHIVIHTEAKYESLFESFVTKASKQASRISPVVQPITAVLRKRFLAAGQAPKSDTAKLLAIDFFHADRHCLTLFKK